MTLLFDISATLKTRQLAQYKYIFQNYNSNVLLANINLVRLTLKTNPLWIFFGEARVFFMAIALM